MPHPIEQSLNPKGKEFLDTYFLPSPEPLSRYDISMAALVAFQRLPHIKAIPAYEMFMRLHLSNRFSDVHTVVVDSSGNTAHAAARLAAALGYKTKVVLSTDTPDSKRGILESLSTVEIIAVPGGVAARAREEAQRAGHFHLNQYSDPANLDSHYLYTGPEVVRALGKRPILLAGAMGTGGTVGGLAKYFGKVYPETKVIGVRPLPGEDVPGARDKERMRESTLEWGKYLDEKAIFEVSRKESFIAMRELWHWMLPQPGPTSGLAYLGLGYYFDSLSPNEREKLRGETIAFVCPDDGRFYSDRIAGELRPEQGLIR